MNFKKKTQFLEILKDEFSFIISTLEVLCAKRIYFKNITLDNLVYTNNDNG